MKSQKLMTAQEIIKEALKQGLLKTVTTHKTESYNMLHVHAILHENFLDWPLTSLQGGKTPQATMSSRMNTDIAQKGNRSPFKKFGCGKFSIG
jgi:hypothetical protein